MCFTLGSGWIQSLTTGKGMLDVCVSSAYSWNHAEALETEAGTRMS